MVFLNVFLFLLGRDIASVMFGGTGTATPTFGGETTVMEGEITVFIVDKIIESLTEASEIMTVPGHGVTVALSQFLSLM